MKNNCAKTEILFLMICFVHLETEKQLVFKTIQYMIQICDERTNEYNPNCLILSLNKTSKLNRSWIFWCYKTTDDGKSLSTLLRTYLKRKKRIENRGK